MPKNQKHAEATAAAEAAEKAAGAANLAANLAAEAAAPVVPEKRGPGRPKSSTPTIAAAKAAIAAFYEGEELPQWLTFVKGGFVKREDGTETMRYTPDTFKSRPFWDVSDDGQTATVVTVTATAAPGSKVKPVVTPGESVSVDKHL